MQPYPLETHNITPHQKTATYNLYILDRISATDLPADCSAARSGRHSLIPRSDRLKLPQKRRCFRARQTTSSSLLPTRKLVGFLRNMLDPTPRLCNKSFRPLMRREEIVTGPT